MDSEIKVVCLEIENRYQVKFLEIGTDKDHAHFLVRSIPAHSVTKLVTLIKEPDSTGDIPPMSLC